MADLGKSRNLRDEGESRRGLYMLSDLRAAGLDTDAIARRVKSGELERVLPTTYRIGGSERSRFQDILAVVLWAKPPAAASHHTAVELHKLAGPRDTRIHVSAARRLRPPSPSIIGHSRTSIAEDDITEVEGIPTTTLARSIIDMASELSSARLDLLIDSALRNGMTPDGLLDRFDTLARSGRNGIRKLRLLLQERELVAVTQNDFEGLLLRVFRRFDLPIPTAQYLVQFEDGFVAKPDFAYPKRRIAIECDSYNWHEVGKTDFDRDRLRLAELASRGWLVIPVTWSELNRFPERVARRVSRALAHSLDT